MKLYLPSPPKKLDALEAIGAASFLVGLWWIWPPLALVIGGLLAIGVALLVERTRRHEG